MKRKAEARCSFQPASPSLFPKKGSLLLGVGVSFLCRLFLGCRPRIGLSLELADHFAQLRKLSSCLFCFLLQSVAISSSPVHFGRSHCLNEETSFVRPN